MKAALLICAVLAAPAHGAVLTLSPATSQIAYTVYALGLLPISAQFGDFAGTVTTRTGAPADCQVQVSVRVASLTMAGPSHALALSAGVLDAARFPIMRFSGHCEGGRLDGQLTLHGITRPLTLTMQRQGREVTATGMLLRRDYAIGGLPGLLGQRIRIRLQAPLPPQISPPP